MKDIKRAKTFAIIISLGVFLGLPFIFLAGVFWQENPMVVPVIGIIWVFGLIFSGINFVIIDSLSLFIKTSTDTTSN